MNPILTAVLSVSGLGLFASLILVIANKVLYMPSNEQALAVEEVLPGVNCGACGYAGCADYAVAVVSCQSPSNRCIPGGDQTAKKIADLMGEENAGNVDEMTAHVACQGTRDVAVEKYDYAGVMTCGANNALHQGRLACNWGCLGFGDCAAVCKFDAITVEAGTAKVDHDRCTGCGACVPACPNGLVHLIPRTSGTVVSCSNRDKGNLSRKECAKSCIACMRCERVCPNDAIHVVGNLAVLDREKCLHCGKCVSECPTGALGEMTIE